MTWWVYAVLTGVVTLLVVIAADSARDFAWHRHEGAIGAARFSLALTIYAGACAAGITVVMVVVR